MASFGQGFRAALLSVPVVLVLAGLPDVASALGRDSNCNGTVDLDAVVTWLFADNACPAVDLNHDGSISAADLALEVQSLTRAQNATPTPTGSLGATPGATASPTGSGTTTPTVIPAMSPTPTATATTTPANTATIGPDGGGAFVATLYNGTRSFFFGGTVSPYAWVTNRDYRACDFDANIDVAPGAGNSWTLSLEYATLSPAQYCSDIMSWYSVPLCTISGTDKGCPHLKDIPVNIRGPACLRGRATVGGTPPPRSGGTASLHCHDATGDSPTHFQGTGGGTTTTSFYGGNQARSSGANSDRNYWIVTGAPIQSCGGVVAVPSAPGSGSTWHIQLAASTTALTGGQNCADLSYTATSDLCTINGTTQKSCSWKPTAITVPVGGCLQVRGVCMGGTCTTFSTGQNYGLDCSTSNTSPYDAGGPTYSDAGSGAFDAGHTFDVGTWAISDAKNDPAPILSQQFWLAPPAGLKACAGAFTFANAIGGTGRYDVGLTVSKTVPTRTQSCLDLSYTSTGTLASLPAGGKSVVFPLTTVTIPGGSCFALNVTTSGGTPSATSNPFNWQAYCVANAN